ncbi:MAG: hypothetical protein ONB42_20940 [candidate division KSB1 bacterium]|nr:hypothetical protein [candidate division KSB1 bacterium]
MARHQIASEVFGKIGEIVEADLVGHFGDFATVLRQRLGGALEAQDADEFAGGVIGVPTGRDGV